MISYLEGEIELKRPGWVILKTAGVGYRVSITPKYLDSLKEGDSVKMYIYTQVREDILALYGFETITELDLFELLLSVSGVGPKAALGILSATSVESIKQSIVTKDPTLISSVSGVGKKTAEKVVLELKNKVGIEGEYSDSASEKAEDVYLALINLGFRAGEARGAIARIPKDCLKTEERLKFCLSQLKKS